MYSKVIQLYIYTNTYIFFYIFFHLGYYKILSLVNRSLLVILYLVVCIF